MSKTIFNFILIGMGSIVIGFSCSDNKATEQESSETNTESQQISDEPYVNYDSIWLEEFVAFRDAVYRQDLKAIKGFVDFPMVEDVSVYFNGISGYPPLPKTLLDYGHISETQFESSFKTMFSDEFIKCLLKVKSRTLVEIGEFVTPELEINNRTISLRASLDKLEGNLSLCLNSIFYSVENDEDVFYGESGVIYYFKLINNKLRFIGVQMAG
jgi:hypothetical protein